MREKDVFAGPFCLVSYSHRDAEAVRDDINALINEGARLWIDHRNDDEENMTYGDNWKDKIKTALNHENCVGAFIYISPYSLAGRATQWEQEQIFGNERLKTSLISINSENRDGGTTVKRHYKLATDLCDEDDSIEPIFINSDYAYGIRPKQEKWINPKNEEIYINRLSSEGCVTELKKVAEALGIISTEAKTKGAIYEDAREHDDGKLRTFGICKHMEMSHITPDTKNLDGRILRGTETYLYVGGKVFSTKPLSWRLLYTRPEDDTNVFIACEVVDDYRGDRLSDFLALFKSLAFSKEEGELIGKIRIPTEADFEKADKCDELLRLPNEQRHRSWWIDDAGILPSWKKAYKDNAPYGQGFLLTLKKGVRPVIEISSTNVNKALALARKK